MTMLPQLKVLLPNSCLCIIILEHFTGIDVSTLIVSASNIHSRKGGLA